MVATPIINELEISKFSVNSGDHTLRPAPTVKENECSLIVVKLITKSVWPLFFGTPCINSYYENFKKTYQHYQRFKSSMHIAQCVVVPRFTVPLSSFLSLANIIVNLMCKFMSTISQFTVSPIYHGFFFFPQIVR